VRLALCERWGGVAAITTGLITLSFWLFAKNPPAIKIAVNLAFIAIAGIFTLCASVASSSAIAEVRHGRLNFYFCGMRTRSIPLDALTMFELRTIGRLRVLSIRSGGSSYVPNGALNIDDVIDLLRANGVTERKAV
jgi:hypothetical protein